MTPHPLLQGPILPTLIRLSAPNVLALSMSVAVSIVETYTMGRLGTVQLAAMALVFPFVMLTQMLSSGAMGGGVSSSIARALGAGQSGRAHELAVHALCIGLLGGVVYSATFVLGGPWIYSALGGRGEVLAEAIAYGRVLFSGAVLVWLMNTMAALLRGTGNMRVPAATILLTAGLQVSLGLVLGLGWGPIPGLGMPGVALAHISATALGVAIYWLVLRSGRVRLKVRLRGVRLVRPLFADILRVGALACLSPLQSVLAALVLTGLVARLGVEALAGYGIGLRLEFMLVPIAFGVGVASVPMVGLAVGAGQVVRAKRVAWTAGLLSGLNLLVVGLLVVIWPELWTSWFSSDPGVLAVANRYLRIAGLAYPMFGLGLTLYLASQGAGKVLGPVLAGTLRLLIILLGGWFIAGKADAGDLFALSSFAMLAYGLASAAALRATHWR